MKKINQEILRLGNLRILTYKQVRKQSSETES